MPDWITTNRFGGQANTSLKIVSLAATGYDASLLAKPLVVYSNKSLALWMPQLQSTTKRYHEMD
uniref:Uncharacterized protein n=1 Tax=Hyaloperonospora arabidopsidis (strain Emoy2) TaxID=559515 RepID=M4C6Q6_HYAAE